MKTTTLLKPLLLSVLLLAIGFTFNQGMAQDKPTWTKYNSAKAKVKAIFPGEFKEEVERGEEVVTYKISAKYGDMVFFIGSTKHSVQLVEHEMLAQTGLEAFAENMGAQIQSTSVWEYKKLKGKKAVMSVTDRNVIVNYRTILTGQIQYQFIAIGESDAYDNDVAEKFFKKIKLLK